jgi:hypothetical protein
VKRKIKNMMKKSFSEGLKQQLTAVESLRKFNKEYDIICIDNRYGV